MPYVWFITTFRDGTNLILYRTRRCCLAEVGELHAEQTQMSITSDVELYRSISELIQESRSWNEGERRDEARRPYECRQLLAPFDGRRVPIQSDFSQVQCLDLTSQGFAFLADERPDFPHVIVALGPVPFKFFVAEIRHVRAADSGAESGYLVGCQFVRRLAETA